MSAQSAASGRLFAGFGIVALGLMAGLASCLALASLSVAKLVFVLGGFALLIPTVVLKEPQAYWLFLLVLSIPFDITKWLSVGFVDSKALVEMYGMPMSGTIGLEVYVTDIVLVVMLLPWLARVGLRRATFFFPRVGYLFILYLSWALAISLINAESLVLAMFELFREVLYFLLFVYLVNNISTRLHFRSVVWAVFLGLIIGAGSVTVFFERGMGTDIVAFANLHDDQGTGAVQSLRKDTLSADMMAASDEASRSLGSARTAKGVKRSQGIFRHPAIPAGLCGLVLPIVLAYLMVARNTRERILLILVYVWGFIGLLLTFSRAGLIGFLAGTLVFFAIGIQTGFLSRRLARISSICMISLFILGTPLLLTYFETRPNTFTMRFYMFEAAFEGYMKHPLLGVGLNNSTGAMREGKQELINVGIPAAVYEPADSYYLAILTEIGPIGSILFFGFFANIVMIALRSMRDVAPDLKPLLVGMVAGLAAVATQSIADGPTAGHAVSATIWLFAALIVTIHRLSPPDTPLVAVDAEKGAFVEA